MYADFRQKVDEKVFNLPRIEFPLKWVFLRSSFAAHPPKNLSISLKAVQTLGMKIGMSIEEIDTFLKQFTSCGSLLYLSMFPSLGENVIVDIPKFAECLEILFSRKGSHLSSTTRSDQPLSLEDSGILSLTAATKKSMEQQSLFSKLW